jgi:DNA-binding LacI/PurR family transcriptional regulator
MRELLASTPDLTAVFAYNDLMAIGAMRAIKASGRRVPQDVSVIGFDDVALAAFVDPPLTTMAQSTAELGRWAFDRLSRSLSTWRGPGGTGTASPEDLVRLPVRLEIRQSTARASASSWTSTDDRSRR